jgi:hypothetical protein
MILLGTLSGAALAQQAPHEMLAAAWEDIEKTVDGTLAPRQHARLNDLAHAAAVDSLCEGFNLDEAKFIAEFEQLAPDEIDSMSAEEVDYFEQHLLVNYGLVTGLFMAEGALDQAGFCEAAEEHRNDPEVANLWQ